MADETLAVQSQDHKLAGSGITSTATSITLQTFDTPDGTDITMADFGGVIGYAVIEPGTTREENISFTGVTQNVDNTAALTGVTRGLAFVSPYAETTALKQPHGGGTTLRISNTSTWYSRFAGLANDETITQTWTFTTSDFPKMSDSTTAPTNDEDLATKKYVDDTAGGTPVSINRTVVSATAGETVADGEVVYQDQTANEWLLADASASATSENVQLGIAQGAGTDGNPITGGVLIIGRDDGQAGFSAGDPVFLTDVAGTLGNSAGTKSVQVGTAISATEIDFTPSYYKTVATADEKAAMAGTEGTPSTSNRFVTDDDTATTSTANDVVRANGSGQIDDSWLALTTEGDILYRDGTNLARLAIGTASQVLAVNSGATAPEWSTAAGGLLDSDTSDTTVSNTVTETSLYSFTVPANTLSTGNVIESRLNIGTTDFVASANTLTIRLKYGATTVAARTITNNSSTGAFTNMRGYIEADLIAAGTTSSQEGVIRFRFSDDSAYENTDTTTSQNVVGYADGTSAEDSTGALTFNVTIEYSSASAANNITVSNAFAKVTKA